MESAGRETDDEREVAAEDGDVAVPANATVAANVLSGSASAGPEVESDQGN